MDLLIYVVVRTIVALLRPLPYRVQLAVCTLLARLVLLVRPRYRFIAERNLSHAFPEKSAEWRAEIIRKHMASLARLIVDFIRLPSVTPGWIREHVSFPDADAISALRERFPERGILFVSGHFDSFEILPHFAATLIGQISYVVRSFPHNSIDGWWNAIRSSNGNTLIRHKGALKRMLKKLREGGDVALLFDQNVVRSNAVFVDWFGRPAATTKALGALALRFRIPVVLVTIESRGADDYTMRASVHEMDDIYRDETLADEDKIVAVTQRVTHAFEEVIRKRPEHWFWFHRRWKTLPEGSDLPDLYRRDTAPSSGIAAEYAL